jgi:hypothetical protein
MAITRENVITKYYSGRLGHVCLQEDGVIRSLPDMSKRKISKNQKQHLDRFQTAKEYGCRAKSDASLSDHYAAFLKKWKKKKKNMGIYQLAIMDFMNPPLIWKITIADENPELVIRIMAMDILMVAGITVKVVSPGGGVVEEGEARCICTNTEYTYPVKHPALLKPGVILYVTARDFPGNITEKILTAVHVDGTNIVNLF